MTEKKRFLARFGTREHALRAIQNDELSHYGMNSAIKNPNLTKEDLHAMATTKVWYQQHAHNEYFNRYGVMPNKGDE